MRLPNVGATLALCWLVSAVWWRLPYSWAGFNLATIQPSRYRDRDRLPTTPSGDVHHHCPLSPDDRLTALAAAAARAGQAHAPTRKRRPYGTAARW